MAVFPRSLITDFDASWFEEQATRLGNVLQGRSDAIQEQEDNDPVKIANKTLPLVAPGVDLYQEPTSAPTGYSDVGGSLGAGNGYLDLAPQVAPPLDPTSLVAPLQDAPVPAMLPVASPQAASPPSDNGTPDYSQNITIDTTQGRDAVLKTWSPILDSIERSGGPSARNMAAVILAENGAGQAGQLASKNNNWFSISYVEGREHQNGPGVGGRFANYDTPLDSAADFVDLISKSPRYKEAWALRNAPTSEFIGALAKGGYIVPEPGFPVEDWLKNTSAGAETYDSVVGVQEPQVEGRDTRYSEQVPDQVSRYDVAFGFNESYGDAQFNENIPNHRGVDLVIKGAENNGRGQDVGAFQSGVVTAVTQDTNGGSGVIIQDKDGLYHRYFHFDSIGVKTGQQVTAGETLGTLGASGTEGFPHVHFEVSKNMNGDPMGELIDPTPYMSGQDDPNAPIPMSSGDEIPNKGANVSGAPQAQNVWDTIKDTATSVKNAAGDYWNQTTSDLDAAPTGGLLPEIRTGKAALAAGRRAGEIILDPEHGVFGQAHHDEREANLASGDGLATLGNIAGEAGRLALTLPSEALLAAFKEISPEVSSVRPINFTPSDPNKAFGVAELAANLAPPATALERAGAFGAMKLAASPVGQFSGKALRLLAEEEVELIGLALDNARRVGNQLGPVVESFLRGGIPRVVRADYDSVLEKPPTSVPDDIVIHGVSGEEFWEAASSAALIEKQTPTGPRTVGETLYVYPKGEYAKFRTFLSEDKLTGFAIKPDGGLISVFNVGHKGAGEQAVTRGVSEGASKLDAFDENGRLPNYYNKFGFEETSREPWNDDYAPPGWRGGTPDVVYMRHPENMAKLMRARTGTETPAERFYHGTTRAFDKPDPSKYDDMGLYGPGQYLTSESRTAGGIVDDYGDVVSQGYANKGLDPSDLDDPDPEDIARAITSRNDAARELQAAKDGTSKLSVEMAQRMFDAQQGTLDNLTSLQPGPNMRAIDVPRDLDMLDMRKPLTSEQATRINTVLDDNHVAKAGDDPDKLWNDLARAYGRKETNDILSEAGFDGITHQGGDNMPMLDPQGQAIKHNVKIIFGQSQDKVTNAISGQGGGSYLGGAAGLEEDEEGNLKLDPGKMALGMLAGQVPGLKGTKAWDAIAKAVKAGADEMAGSARRLYHGTSQAFDSPNPLRFDKDGLAGPGYYLTDSPRVAASGDRANPGYAEARAIEQGDALSVQKKIDGWEHVLDTTTLESKRVQARALIATFTEQLEKLGADAPAAQSRAIDVPSDLRLLNLEDITIQDTQDILGSLKPAQRTKVTNIVNQLSEQNGTPFNRNTYEALDKALGGKDKANQVLASIGYDGIKYDGGRRIPMRDDRGVPIEHQATVIFPESLPKITNAISGQRGGAFLGSGAGFEQDEEGNVSLDPQKAALGVLAMSIPGLRNSKAWKALSSAKPATAANIPKDVSIGQWVKAGLYNSMLSGPRTLLVNMAGAVEPPYKLLRDSIGQSPETTWYELAAGLKSVDGAAAGAIEAFRHGLSEAQATNTGGRTALPGKLGFVVELPMRITGAVDEFIHGIVYGMEQGRQASETARQFGSSIKTRAQMFDHLMANPTDVMSKQALREADFATYRNELGDQGKAMGEWLKKSGWVGEALVPFYKTIVQINARGIDRSGIGLVATAFDASLKRSTSLNPDMNIRVKDGIMGAGLGLVAFSMAAQSEITGAGPDDLVKRQDLERTGWQPYSIKVGGKYYSYAQAGSWAVPLAASAALAETGLYPEGGKKPSEKLLQDKALEVARRFSELWTEQGYMSTTVDLFGYIKDGNGEGVNRFLADQVSRRIPYGAAINTVAQSQDQIMRAPEGIGERVQNRFPELPGSLTPSRMDLPPALDVYGQERKNPQYGSGALNPFRTPAIEKADRVDRELVLIGASVTRAPDKIGEDTLTREQKFEYQRMSGANIHAALDTLIDTDEYKRSNEDRKKSLISIAQSDARDRAGRIVLATSERTFKETGIPQKYYDVDTPSKERAIDQVVTKVNEYLAALKEGKEPQEPTDDDWNTWGLHKGNYTEEYKEEVRSRAKFTRERKGMPLPFDAR